MRELIDVDRMAALLNVPKNWIYQHTLRTAKKRIPHVKVGRYVRFDPEEVMAWLKTKGESSHSADAADENVA